MNDLDILQNIDNEDEDNQEKESSVDMEAKLPLQLAIVGRPNVGKSTLLNAILQEDRVLVGPEAGLTRDSIRTQFHYEGRTIYLVGFTCLLSLFTGTIFFHNIPSTTRSNDYTNKLFCQNYYLDMLSFFKFLKYI